LVDVGRTGGYRLYIITIRNILGAIHNPVQLCILFLCFFFNKVVFAMCVDSSQQNRNVVQTQQNKPVIVVVVVVGL
jgi:hypothetical protein